MTLVERAKNISGYESLYFESYLTYDSQMFQADSYLMPCLCFRRMVGSSVENRIRKWKHVTVIPTLSRRKCAIHDVKETNVRVVFFSFTLTSQCSMYTCINSEILSQLVFFALSISYINRNTMSHHQQQFGVHLY